MKMVLLVLVAVTAVLADDILDSKFDSFDADAVVADPELLKVYEECFLEEGDCTPEGTLFKKVLLESLSTSCAKCSLEQRHIIRTLVKGIQVQMPEKWAELEKKHDPEEKHKELFEKFLSSSE